MSDFVGAVSVQASVHRSDTQPNEDALNNNSPAASRVDNSRSRSMVSNNDQLLQPRTRASLSSSGVSDRNEHSISSESELPIEQYKPRKPVNILPGMKSVGYSKSRSLPQDNGNDGFLSTGACTAQAMPSVAKNYGAPKTVPELCQKLALEVCMYELKNMQKICVANLRCMNCVSIFLFCF